MTFLAISFIAGVLTVLAPCILPLLPVVVGSSVAGRSKATPYIVVASLSVSIILFTFLLKVSTAFIAIPPAAWAVLSGTILVFFGVTLVFPSVWNSVPGLGKTSRTANKLLGTGHQKKSLWGDALVGASLGPIFTTCSPTYFVILASVLPASLGLGVTYLLAYITGLALVLLLIALLGEKFAAKLSVFSDPNSKFKHGLGILFIVLGLMIMTGYEKKLETAILDSGYFDITKVENQLLERAEPTASSGDAAVAAVPYKEIVNPSGFVNTAGAPVTIGEYVGKQVILLDVMTYSCINCQRTFPYVTSWYETYKDDGLMVIGIHTPEFAFEKDSKNVAAAMEQFGIRFPVVLDNEYATWNAYGNRFWPRKYLIDIHGNIVYDHIGEGAYKETEQKIQELLKERRVVLKMEVETDFPALVAESLAAPNNQSDSPETYFGAKRNTLLANGEVGVAGLSTFAVPANPQRNKLYLTGAWNVQPESAGSVSDAGVLYRYQAEDVYVVGSAAVPTEIEVWQDGVRLSEYRGADVDAAGVMIIDESRLYKIIENQPVGEHLLELRVKGSGVKLFAFTFG